MKIIINGKTIGVVDGNVFKKTVSKKKHLFKKLNAWAIDAGVFNHEIFKTCNTIEVFDKDDRKTYTTTVDNFNIQAVYLNLGYGLQRFLPLTAWEVK